MKVGSILLQNLLWDTTIDIIGYQYLFFLTILYRRRKAIIESEKIFHERGHRFLVAFLKDLVECSWLVSLEWRTLDTGGLGGPHGWQLTAWRTSKSLPGWILFPLVIRKHIIMRTGSPTSNTKNSWKVPHIFHRKISNWSQSFSWPST